MGAIALACEGSVNFFGDQIARLCLDRIQTVLKTVLKITNKST